ncbi:ParA family protein [Jeotgalibacillus marinus]|uniref:Uncharacterized protein n=1 Tax=Jeotgalibacillus marinus TaxID=86667 RepID=A0ABV3Q4E3_9BACL
MIIFDGAIFSYYAISKFLEIIEETRDRYNPTLNIAGILFSLIDSRAKEIEIMEEAIYEDHPNLKFNTVIKRKASTRRLSITGFEGDSELKMHVMA